MTIRKNIPWIPLFLAIALLGVAPPGWGQAPDGSSWEPARHSGESLTLIDAVQLALSHNPNIRLEEESSRLQEGFLQEMSGRFDSALFSDLNFDYRRDGLRASILREELENRADLDNDIFEGQQQLAFNTLVLEQLQSLQSDPLGFRVSDPQIQGFIDLLNLQIDAASGQLQADLVALRDSTIAAAIAQTQEAREDILAVLATDMEFRTNLGAAPTDQENYFGRFNLRYSVPLRSGITVGPFFDYTLSGDRYVGKPVDLFHGGKGIQDVYRGELGLNLSLPLGRGLGQVATAADERAARFSWQAGRANLDHVGTSTVLGTTLAYWELVGAQERVRAFDELMALQERLVELTGALIRADEVAPTEASRVRARHAEIASQRADALRAEQAARVALADTLGLQVGSIEEAPRAADAFPQPSADLEQGLDTPALITAAKAQRDDYVAAQLLVESTETLLRAARANLRPIVDLDTRAWMTGVGENDARGSVSDRWVAPSYQVGLHVDWPLANNGQRGRLVQARARDQQQRIVTGDLERRIGLSITELVTTLQLAADQIRLASEAVSGYEESLEAEIELFRSGESTLVNTLLTEQRLTEARLGGIAARQLYAQLLAQLRFVSGTLVTNNGDGVEVDESALLTPPTNRSNG